MQKKTKAMGAIALFLLSACATTSTTPLAQNVFRIDVSAAPACGSSGAARLVNRMAAVETIRLGFDKYNIAAMDSENNVRVVGANYRTSGTVSTFGTGATYSGTTTATPIIAGSQDAALIAVMFRAGDPEGANALDARQMLGAEWQEIVAKGAPTTCFE